MAIGFGPTTRVHALEEVLNLRGKVQPFSVFEKHLVPLSLGNNPRLPPASDALDILVAEGRARQCNVRLLT